MSDANHLDGGPDAASPRRAILSRWSFTAVAALLYWFAVQGLRPLVTLRLDELGATDGQIAFIVAVYPISALILAIPGGRLLDRVGLMRVLLASFGAMVLVGGAYVVAGSPGQILAVQAVNGIAELGAWLGLQALASHAGTGPFLSRQLAVFSLGWGIGTAAGPTVGAWMFHAFGFPSVGAMYAACAALGLATAALVPYRGREAQAGGSEGAGVGSVVRGILRRPAVKGVLLSSFVALYVVSLMTTFYPLALERRGIPVPQIGMLLSAAGAASLLVRVPLPGLMRRFGGRRVLLWSMWSGAIGVAAVPFLPLWLLAVAAVAAGAGYGANPPVTVELMARHTRPVERGVAMGMRVTSNRLATLAQPLVFGGVTAVAGMAAAFPVAGAVLAGLTLLTARVAPSSS